MHRYVIIDVFTDTPLEGNPLAVFTDASGIPPARMQQIARELNLSETAFVLPVEDAYNDADARIRIFTPSAELPFAGHPTLGSAFVLRTTGAIRLQTGAGVVPVEFERDGGQIRGRMKQPIPTWERYERSEELLAALGVDSAVLPVEAYRNGPRHVFVALPDEEAVAKLDPNLGALAKLSDIGTACFAGSGERWKTRNFSPAFGIGEDPATGSAAGPLAVHLVRHGLLPFGREIEISQGTEIGRPSTLYARVEGDGDRIDAVEVAGSAVVVGRGELDA